MLKEVKNEGQYDKLHLVGSQPEVLYVLAKNSENVF